MGAFRIPSSVQLHGFTIPTVYDDKLEAVTNNYGESWLNQQKIVLQKITDGASITETKQAQVYCHELVHNILAHLNEDKLNDNEKFVNSFGYLLHQALDSAKYGADK